MTDRSIESEHRLQHSPEGLQRLSEMEDAQLHIYVEGENGDRYYYAKVLSGIFASHGMKPEFHLAREIRGNGEGKSRCLQYHDFLEAHNRLISSLDGKLTVNCFILDKDIDDLLGILRSSAHIVYTYHYCVENHIVKESNLADAVAAATGMDTATLQRLIPRQEEWLQTCCELWEEWTAICIFAHSSKCGLKNYARGSAVNVPIDQPADPQLVTQSVQQIGVRLALGDEDAYRKYEEALQVVREHRNAKEQDKVFKGKWYAALLSRVGMKATGLGSFDEKMLWSSLCSQVAPTHLGSDHFRAAVGALIRSKLMPTAPATPDTPSETPD